MSNGRDVRLVQRNSAPADIYALVGGPDGPVGYGPLAMDLISVERYADPSRRSRPGDPALGAELVAAESDFHPLDDFFRFYHYPDDLIEWIEATPLHSEAAREGLGWYEGGGRDSAEVARRLNIDEARLRWAGMEEGAVPGARDPAGDPVYYSGFGGNNWAVADPSGRVTINPNAYRFKAWLSLEGMA